MDNRKNIFCNILLLFIFSITGLNAAACDNLARIESYAAASKYLQSLSDTQLCQILESGERANSSWSTALKVKVGKITLFVKKIPLTVLESKPENYRSTANLFKLPTYYQYGVGSAGFSAWRELQAHITTTNWVISGACFNFPILYHWRLLPNGLVPPITQEKQKKINKAVKYWGGSQAIRARLEALQKAPTSIVLFLEYIPQTSKTWLEQQLKLGNESALIMIEKDILTVISFMTAHGLLHFDANFNNILTDGHRLYFTDFGLALSSEFSLSEEELNFFSKHQHYDRYNAITSFVYSIITSLYGRKNYDKKLNEYESSKNKKSITHTIINRYAKITITMDKFYINLFKDKSTLYPVEELDRLWKQTEI